MEKLWILLYAMVLFIILWLLARLVVWRISCWMKRRFCVDVTVKSIGLFAAYDITIRINQLQTIEIDQIALKLNIFINNARHLVSVHVGETRIRAEMKPRTDLNTSNPLSLAGIDQLSQKDKTKSINRMMVFNLLQRIFKYMSIDMEGFNIMLLNLLVPDSLVHVNVNGIQLSCTDSTSYSSLAACLQVENCNGKILKSLKGATEVTSCIAETSLRCTTSVCCRRTAVDCVTFSFLDVKLSKLHVELHEGAVIPGILLPAPCRHFSPLPTLPQSPPIEQMKRILKRGVGLLPCKSSLQIDDFWLAFYGDETMGETVRGAHVCARHVQLNQVKNTDESVYVFPPDHGGNTETGFRMPSGVMRLQVDDVSLTDHAKRKVANMGKSVWESKLSSNGIFSTSVDLTAWHGDYKHRESVEFWSIIIHKLHEAARHRDEHCRVEESGAGVRLRRVVRSPGSATTAHFHPDILQGIRFAQSRPSVELQRGEDLTLAALLRQMDISFVLEYTVYDASIQVLMLSPFADQSQVQDDGDNAPSFTISLDNFTGSFDQSSNSTDINFMLKVEHLSCMVSQENFHMAEDYLTQLSSQPQPRGYRPKIHQWGQTLGLDQLNVHGSCGLKPYGEISLLIDTRLTGLQVEASKRAAQAFASLMPLLEVKASGLGSTGKSRVTITCLDSEMCGVNFFILANDDTRCAECVVARLDRCKINSTTHDTDDRSPSVATVTTTQVQVSGVGVTTVPNPYFSAFAAYEAEKSGVVMSRLVSESVMLQQHEASEYFCCEAACMASNMCYLAIDLFEICYSRGSKSNGDGMTSSLGGRKVTVGLSSSQGGARVRWSPSFHQLVHTELTDIYHTVIASKKPSSCPVTSVLTPDVASPPSSRRQTVSACGDNSTVTSSMTSSTSSGGIGMMGDGVKKDEGLVLDVELAPIFFTFDLWDKSSITLHSSPFRLIQEADRSHMSFTEFLIMMDGHEIFIFSNNTVELSLKCDNCIKHRRSFADLTTATNRCWTFNIGTMTSHFPYQYDFAATFDRAITCFKWVKRLYKPTSHPFRSARLPPDLQINIRKFTMELADSKFECKLRDNHELMMDEWGESEKRRRVLDQRMMYIRRQRGELLPAKQVEELYCQLSETNINIYLIRSRKMYKLPSNTVLLTWSLENFQLTVLADRSMHGMDNALSTIRSLDPSAPFPFHNYQDVSPSFVTLWCRNVVAVCARHQVRVRNYPQCLMDYSEWELSGKLCGGEQKGTASAQRTDYVHLPAPWKKVAVQRNMPPLKFYHDLTSNVNIFQMAWGPCWEPAWSQVNLAINLLSKTSIDPSRPLPWWDKSRLLFHGNLNMNMDRVNMLHLASLDPFNTTEHMLWDWKQLRMGWTPGCFLFKGDLDIHIRNASKYDDVRFLHLPRLRLHCPFQWVCLNGANPSDHYAVMPCSPDNIEDSVEHDTYRKFRSRNIDMSINFDTRHPSDDPMTSSSTASADAGDKPEMLLYSSTMRWLSNFWLAVNAVVRPICKGPIFKNDSTPKLKLSRHYRNVKASFDFPQLKVSYWSSYAQQLGIELVCGSGMVASHFRLRIVPFEGKLNRRSRAEWSVIGTTCHLSDTKIYLLKRQEKQSPKAAMVSSLHTSSVSGTLSSTSSLGVDRNFLLSLSKMTYGRDNVNYDNSNDDVVDYLSAPEKSTKGKPSSPTFDQSTSKPHYTKLKTPTSPTKRPQNRQTLTIHDLRAMWTTENRDVCYGLYEAYNKAAVLRHNLSTNILHKIGIETSSNKSDGDRNKKQPETSEVKSTEANLALHKFLADNDNRFVVSAAEASSELQLLKGMASSRMDDVVNTNWLINFVNCQAMLKGPKTQGYIILTAAEAEFLNREHKVSWRDGQLTTKSSWIGSLAGTQVFATVERNATSSGQDGEDVPWLAVSDIAPRGPSPGMLDINDLMGGGQAIGGVVGDGLSAGSFQLQRVMSRCTCRMFYVGYEALVDSEQTDYGRILPVTPDERPRTRGKVDDLLGKEKPVNVLTILQPELEICTNTSQFNMILDIVENLVLYVEPVMRSHWERVDRMRFALRLTSADDAAKHRQTLAAKQNHIRTRLTNMRQLERTLYRTDRALDADPSKEELYDQASNLRRKLAEEKEILNEESEELGIIIRCFKEMYLEQKTRLSSLRGGGANPRKGGVDEEESEVLRTTEVSFGQVKWHLTDADGQLNIAQFEMRDFLYEKVNKSDDSASHCFELGWLRLQNLLPNSLYRDVIRPHHQMGLRSRAVTGAGGQTLTLRVLCKVRPPVGGISVKDHVELNAVPLTIQLTFQFFKRMMGFFFPDKSLGGMDDYDDLGCQFDTDQADSRNATLLGLPALASPSASKPLSSRPSSTQHQSTPASHRRAKSLSSVKRGAETVGDDVEKMKERAAKNNTFLYIKITQVPLCVSYKGEKEKNIEDVHEFNLTIPMLEYHSMTWTWHDFALAVKRDCKKQLVSQLIKEKLHITSRSRQQQPATSSSLGTDVIVRGGESAGESEHALKTELLLGKSLQRDGSHKRAAGWFPRKKK